MIVPFILTYVALSSAAFVMGILLDQENRLVKLLSPSYMPSLGTDFKGADLKENNLDKLLSPSFKISAEGSLPKVGLNHEVLETLVQLSEKYPDREVQVQIEFSDDGQPKKLRKSMPGSRSKSGLRKIKRSRQPLQYGAHPVQTSEGLNVKDLFRLLGVKELRTVNGEVITADVDSLKDPLQPVTLQAAPNLTPQPAATYPPPPSKAGAPPAPGMTPPAPAVTPPEDLIDEATRPVVMKDLWMHLGGNCVSGNCRPGAKRQNRGQGQQGPGQQGNGPDEDNMQDEYDDQADAAEEFIKMIREKVTVKRVSPKNQKTKWYKLVAGDQQNQ